MFCKKCGKQIDDGSKFCEFCGAKVDDYSTDVKPKTKTPAKTVAAKKKKTGDTKNTILSILGLAFFVLAVVRMCSFIGGDDGSSSTDNTTQTEQTEQKEKQTSDRQKVKKDPSTISSIEEAKAFIEGKTFMATPAGGMAGLWHKVSFSNGRFTLRSAWPSAGEWTSNSKGNYTIVEGRYADTGQRYFSVEMTPDGEKNSYGCLAFVVNNTAFVDCLGNAATATIGDRNPWD